MGDIPGDPVDRPCVVDANGYCPRHKTTHTGRLLELALMDNETGRRYRLLWDAQVAAQPNPSPPVRRRGCGCGGKNRKVY